jgi:hypothetical protein
MSRALVLNVAAFQAGWFALVLGAAHGYGAWGVAFAALLVARHVVHAARPLDELALIVIAGALGGLFECVLAYSGLVGYGAAGNALALIPLWMVALWMLFATTANLSLRWLRQRTALAVLLGAAGGPLAYWGGVKLGALQLTDPVISLAAIGAGWAILLPLLLRLALHYDGYAGVSAFDTPGASNVVA